MDRREKASLNRDKAVRLNKAWGVNAEHVRYSDDGHWYAMIRKFPAALFDAQGYVVFATEQELRNTPAIALGKQISIRKPGISKLPNYVRVLGSDVSPGIDVDIHTVEAIEGHKRLVLHLQRERNRNLIRRKKQHASSLRCEVCCFSFQERYGDSAGDYCEVHHLKPFSEIERSTRTRMQDLAILCANCHRVVHLRTPPYTLDEVRNMLTNASGSNEEQSF